MRGPGVQRERQFPLRSELLDCGSMPRVGLVLIVNLRRLVGLDAEEFAEFGLVAGEKALDPRPVQRQMSGEHPSARS